MPVMDGAKNPPRHLGATYSPGAQDFSSRSSIPGLRNLILRALNSLPVACLKAFLLTLNFPRMDSGELLSSNGSLPPFCFRASMI